MSLAVAFPPAASSALAGSTMPGSRGFHGGLPAPVLSPCFPGFFTDSTSSQNSFCFAPLASTTTPCFPADTTFPERPPQRAPGGLGYLQFRKPALEDGEQVNTTSKAQ